MATDVSVVIPQARSTAALRNSVATIVASYAYNDPALAAGKAMPASVPAGHIIISADAIVTTAFNAGTTNPVQVGTTPLGGEILASTDVVAGTTGKKTADKGPLLGPLAVDTPLYVNYVPTGTAPTAGVVHIVIRFVRLG